MLPNGGLYEYRLLTKTSDKLYEPLEQYDEKGSRQKAEEKCNENPICIGFHLAQDGEGPHFRLLGAGQRTASASDKFWLKAPDPHTCMKIGTTTSAPEGGPPYPNPPSWLTQELTWWDKAMAKNVIIKLVCPLCPDPENPTDDCCNAATHQTIFYRRKTAWRVKNAAEVRKLFGAIGKKRTIYWAQIWICSVLSRTRWRGKTPGSIATTPLPIRRLAFPEIVRLSLVAEALLERPDNGLRSATPSFHTPTLCPRRW